MSTSEAARKKKLDTVRALLDRAQHPGTSAEEAAACSAKAEEIMLAYGLESALLAAPTLDESQIDVTKIKVGTPYTREKIGLLHAIAVNNDCHTLVMVPGDGNYGRGVTVEIAGFPEDRDRVEFLFTSLLIQATNGVLKAKPRPGSREYLPNFKSTWLIGFAQAVQERFAAMRARLTAEADATRDSSEPGAALVLATRAQMALAFMKRRHPGDWEDTSTKVRGSGATAGRAAGHQADLGTDRFDPTARKAIAS
jgi:hypothetical protein